MKTVNSSSVGTGKSTSSMWLSTFSVPQAAGILLCYSSETLRHPYSVRRSQSEMKIVFQCRVMLLVTVKSMNFIHLSQTQEKAQERAHQRAHQKAHQRAHQRTHQRTKERTQDGAQDKA